MKRELAYVWNPIMESSSEVIQSSPYKAYDSREEAEKAMENNPEWDWYIEELPEE